MIFALVEEAIWAGDPKATNTLKALATANEYDYERKGLDAYRGKSYLRLMFASNDPWVVPAGSGGRRWFVTDVGDEHEQDHAYFAAIKDELQNGGLAAMLYDLLRHDFSRVNLREVPITEELVEQRLHSYSTRKRWWRETLSEGGFYIDRYNEPAEFIELHETQETIVPRSKVFESAKPHFGNERRKASRTEVGTFLCDDELDGTGFIADGPRPSINGGRERTYVFPPLCMARKKWEEDTGEHILRPATALRDPITTTKMS